MHFSKRSPIPDFIGIELSLTQTVLHHLAQFGFLDMFAGNNFGQVGLAIRVYFQVSPLPKLGSGVGTAG